MKEEALAIAAGTEDVQRKMNILREYVQTFTLRVLHDVEAFSSIGFVGGTALRFLNNLPRYSEDLDFSLSNHHDYNPVSWMKKLKDELIYAGFEAEVSWNEKNVVNYSWIKIPGLLKEAGISDRKEQKLSIKLEIDTNPPQGAVIKKSLVTRRLTFAVAHYDLQSLMAGKVHAVICRNYFKGRDWYDLVWYLSHRPPVSPNLVLLQNALNQTHPESGYVAKNWKQSVMSKFASLDEKRLIEDVRPFLERPEDADLLKEQYLRQVITDVDS